MNRRYFIAKASAALVAPLLAWAQAPRATFRVAYVAPSAGPTPITEAFRRALADLGYVEGRTVAIQYCWMAGREAEYPAVLDSLGGNVDVVVVYGDVGIAAARRMSDTTSVVFVNASEPVALGVVHSFARPGGNMTGISYMANELTGKRLELLREMLPRVSRIAVLVNPNNPAAPLDVHEVEAAGRALGGIVKRFDAPRPESFDGVITQIAQEGFGGVVVGADGMLYTHREKLRAPIASHRLPDSYAFREFVQVGGLLAYGANLTHLAARAAGYVARLLSGDKPANLPVERPTKIDLAINLKTAKALGVTVPPALLLWADEVIE